MNLRLHLLEGHISAVITCDNRESVSSLLLVRTISVFPPVCIIQQLVSHNQFTEVNAFL